MSRPWMSLYVGDYLADTAHLRTAEHGAYLLLIMHYWRTGGLPDNDEALSRIARMTKSEWAKARPVVSAFFQPGWRHKRVDHELAEAERISNAGKKAGLASAAARQTNKQRSLNDATNDIGNDPSTNGQPSQSQSQTPSESKKETREVALSADFDAFWDEWPNKVGKPAAARAFASAVKRGAGLWDIQDGMRNYIRAKPPDRPWLNPATFLNQNRWEDQPAQVQNGKTETLSNTARRHAEQGIEFGARPPAGLRVIESVGDVRLLSQAGRERS